MWLERYISKPVMKNRVAPEIEQAVIAVLALAAKRAVRVILETRNAVGHFEPRSSRAPNAEAGLDFGFVVEGSAHHRANT